MKTNSFLCILGLILMVCVPGYSAATEQDIDFDHLCQEMDEAGLESMYEASQPSEAMVMVRRIFTPLVMYMIRCYEWVAARFEQQRVALGVIRAKRLRATNDSESYVN